MKILVADTSPLISLAIIDKLDLLLKIFDEIYIPEKVYQELSYDLSKPKAKLLADFFKDKIKKINNINELSLFIYEGESEAIILAKELKADYLLIDDLKGRTVAEILDIKCIGILGFLLIGKNKGFIKALKPLLRKLRDNKRYYSDKLVNIVLNEAGE